MGPFHKRRKKLMLLSSPQEKRKAAPPSSDSDYSSASKKRRRRLREKKAVRPSNRSSSESDYASASSYDTEDGSDHNAYPNDKSSRRLLGNTNLQGKRRRRLASTRPAVRLEREQSASSSDESEVRLLFESTKGGDDSSDSDYTENDNLEKDTKRKAAVRGRRHAAATKRTGPQWTEIMGALHVFEDEIYSFLRTDQGSCGADDSADDLETTRRNKRALLNSWTNIVQQEFTQRDTSCIETMELCKEDKQLGDRIRRQQDTLVAQRSKLRALRHEAGRLQDSIAMMREKTSTWRAASRFLDKIDQLKDDKE